MNSQNSHYSARGAREQLCTNRELADPSEIRVVCGARRRRDGKPCEALSVPGRRRCKWHGGMSTGPRTAAGRAKVTANLRRPADE
jgi:hypothetical protein